MYLTQIGEFEVFHFPLLLRQKNMKMNLGKLGKNLDKFGQIFTNLEKYGQIWESLSKATSGKIRIK